MLPLNLCHLSDQIMHINKKSQPINALRQVRSFSLSILRSHALQLLLSCVNPHRSFCFTAYIRRQSSTALRIVRTQILYRAAYFTVRTHLNPLMLCVPTQFSCFCSAYPRSHLSSASAYLRISTSSSLRTHAEARLNTCVPQIRAELTVHQYATESQMLSSARFISNSTLPTAFLQILIYAIVQYPTRVYMQLPFKEFAYEIQDTEVLNLQLPLILVCLYDVLCYLSLTVLPSSSISSSVMMSFSPFDMVPILCSCIP